MTVRNRGIGKKKRWYYDFMIRGVRYKGAVPEARTKEDAEKAENKIKKDAYDGKYGKFSGNFSFTEFAKKTYLDWAKLNKRWWYTDSLIVETLCLFFDKKTFQEITPSLIEKFKRQRRTSSTRNKKSRAAATVNRELAVLSKILSLAIDDEIIETNPCSRVKRFRLSNERTRYLTHEEEAQLMNALKEYPFLGNIVTMAIYTGFRRGEIFRLKWTDVDFNLRIVRAIDKNGEEKAIPMANKLLKMLQSLPKDNELVFPSPRTQKQLTDVKKGFKKARETAGIKNLHFHDLRHTTATRLAENGNDIVTIAEILGHKDLRMTKRYTHATSKSKRRAIDSLDNTPIDCPKFVPNENRQASEPA